jgi:hypothetical protein
MRLSNDQVTHLSRGMWGSSLSDGSTQRISGGGLPWAEQLSIAPVEFENSSNDGGSWRNTGPWMWGGICETPVKNETVAHTTK